LSPQLFFFAGRVAKIGQPKKIFLLPLHWALRLAYQLYQRRAKPGKDDACGEAKAVRRLGIKLFEKIAVAVETEGIRCAAKFFFCRSTGP